jgi:hypothetical protein
MLVVADAKATQACIGDCNGDGQVAISELIVGVRIGLGQAAVSECPAFDADMDGRVTIAELVQAVAAALAGCPATPTLASSATPAATPTDTASPTQSPTATASPTESPTATVPPTATAAPTVPMVSGRWLEQPLAVTTFTCDPTFTQAFESDLSKETCEQMIIASSSAEATLVDCKAEHVDGTLDRDGTLHFTYPTTTGVTGDCTIRLTTSLSVPAAVSPTTAAYTWAISFSAGCGLGDCTIDAQAMWARD